jgi:3D (Asp-Asp-Asp) domain-containing protein
MEVKVSAYNALPGQTKAINPDIAAWGDTLREGMKAIAVSRDLLKLGLVHGAVVRIEGLEGAYVVRDKMNQRYRRRIDLFMGLDVDSAREWGVRKRQIEWEVERESVFDKRYQYQPPDSLNQPSEK